MLSFLFGVHSTLFSQKGMFSGRIAIFLSYQSQVIQFYTLVGFGGDHGKEKEELGVYFVTGVLVVEPHLILK